MSNNHSESPTLTGQSSPDQQGPPEIASSVSLTDLFPSVPRAPPATPQRSIRPGHGAVFPPYIYINYEGFMRAADPFWEPDRLATSCMYTFARSSHAGQVICSDRMAQWLDQQREQSQSRRSGHSPQVLHHQRRQRPGVSSSPGHHLHRHAHLTTDGSTGAQILGLPFTTASGGPTAVSGQLPDAVTSVSLQHPNPLRQHPVRPQDVPVKLRIPKRKSSLQHNRIRGSFLDPEQSTIKTDEELARGLQSIQLGDTVEFLGSERDGRPSESSTGTQIRYDITMVDAPAPPHRSNDATVHDQSNKRKSIGTQVIQLFGGEDNKKKRARSEVRQAIFVALSPKTPFFTG